MASLYSRIAALCDKKNITGYKLCTDLGISRSVLSDLKSGRKKTLNANTASAIAEYFGVSVSYLLGTSDAPENDAELMEYLEELKNRQEMRMLFKLAKNASKEDVEAAVRIIEALRR